jgi:hypothetical protein
MHVKRLLFTDRMSASYLISPLTVFTPILHFPLHQGLFVLQSSNVISATAALLLALCVQSHIATIYYLWACLSYKRDGKKMVPGPPSLLDQLNLVQLLLR